MSKVHVAESPAMACRAWLRWTNLSLFLLGLAWAGVFVGLEIVLLDGRIVRHAESWQTEHTVALVFAVVGLIGPRLLRPSPEAARTLVHGRPEGLRDALASTLPPLCAAVIMLATMSSLFPDHRCCFCALPSIEWDPRWSLYWIVPSLGTSLVAASSWIGSPRSDR